MNLNTLVLENIVQSSYYKNYLSEITTYQGLIDEIYYNVTFCTTFQNSLITLQVKHLEPWERGTRRTTGMTGMCGGVRPRDGTGRILGFRYAELELVA